MGFQEYLTALTAIGVVLTALNQVRLAKASATEKITNSAINLINTLEERIALLEKQVKDLVASEARLLERVKVLEQENEKLREENNDLRDRLSE